MNLAVGNATETTQDLFSIFQNVVYITIGFPTSTISILFIFAVLKNKTLRERNDLLIYSGLATADSLFGLACLSAGIRRLWVLTHQPQEPVSACYCMYATVHSPLFIVAHISVPLMYCAVSIDRLICVLHVLYYIGLGRSYAAMMLAVPVAITAATCATAWTLSAQMPADRIYAPTCVVEFTDPDLYSVVTYTMEATIGGISCILYMAVMISFKLKADVKFADARINRIKERERKVTQTLGMVSVLTFLLSVLPFIAKAVSSYGFMETMKARLSPTLTSIVLLNSLCNVVLYLSKQGDVRHQIFNLFRGIRVVDRSSAGRAFEMRSRAHSKARPSIKVIA